MTADLSLGSVLGDYRLERIAGRGGMGVVYEATELTMSRRVALKVIASDLADDESFRQRFVRELGFVVGLEHPNVIPVYRAGEVDGVLYIAMRFVAGIDLRVLLSRSGRLRPLPTARILAQVGAALDRAHAAGLVHRDVKPGNILLDGTDASSHVYLTDFGLTKHVTSAGGLTRPGALVGTPGYIAPEQVLGEPVDARTDVYSLTCVLFEMLTGQPPYPRDSEAAMLFAHVQEEPPSVLAVAPDVNEGFEEVVARGMATAREDRYQSAGDLARAASLAAEDRLIVVEEESVATGAAAPKAIDTRLSAIRWRSRTSQGRSRSSSAPRSAPAAPAESVSPAPPASGDSEPQVGAVGTETPADAPLAAAGPGVAPPPASPERRGRSAAAARRRPSPPSGGPPTGGARRNRLLALAAVAVILVVGIAAALMLSGGDPPPTPVAEEPAAPSDDPIEVGARPAAVVTGGGSTWVANADDGTVTRIDTGTGRTTGRPIEVGGSPTALAAADGFVFALDAQTGRLTVIDAQTGRIAGRPSTHPGEAVAAGFGSAWVVNGTSGDVVRVDPASGDSVGSPIEVGSFPVRAAVGEGAVWVVNSDSGTLSRVDPDSDRVTDPPIPVGRGATDVAVGDGAVWVANPAAGRVLRVDPDAARSEPVSIDVPGARWIAAGDGAVWVSGAGAVVRIDPRTNRVTGERRELPDGAALAVSGGAVWVARPDRDDVVRLGY